MPYRTETGIRKQVFKLPDGKQYTHIMLENYEKVSAIDTIRTFKFAIGQANFDDYYQGKIVSREQKNNYLKNIVLEIEEELKNYKSIQLPKDMLELLNCPRKSRQEEILQNAKLNQNQLWAFFIKAGEIGYTISHYKSEHLPTGINPEDLPILFERNEDNSITKYGKTNLTDAQLSQILDHRKITKVWILEKEDIWFCFFYTDKSITGQERGNIKHMHFISNAWTKPKEVVIAQLKEKKYNLNSTWHIEYTETNPSY